MVFMCALSPASDARSKYAELVVDGKSGRVLIARNVDDRKYPASLTKIMTLYMMFELLDKGTLRLDQKLKTSRRAAGQPASKLGLRQGDALRHTKDIWVRNGYNVYRTVKILFKYVFCCPLYLIWVFRR